MEHFRWGFLALESQKSSPNAEAPQRPNARMMERPVSAPRPFLSKVSYEKLVHFRKSTETNIQDVIVALRRELFAGSVPGVQICA